MAAQLRKWLLRLLLRLVRPLVFAAYKAVLMLRLGVQLLEREVYAGAGGGAEQEAQQRLLSGAAWADFCDSLRGLGDVPLAVPATPALRYDPPDRVEGFRYLTRLLRAGLEGFVEAYSPEYPWLKPLPANVKIGADNPDNLYMFAPVSGQHEYRLVGHRGTVTYLSLAVYSGNRPGQGSTEPATLDSGRLVTQPDGSFEVVLSAQPGGANWLRLAPDATRLVVRQTFLDRSQESAAQLRLLRVAPPDEERRVLQASQVVAGLAGAAMLAAGSAMQFNDWVAMFARRNHNALGTLPNDTYMSAWADPSIFFYHGYFDLPSPQHVLLVLLRPPQCVYWNFQLNNCWMESLADDERHGSALGTAAAAAVDAAAAPPAGAPEQWVDHTTQSGGGVTHVNKAKARYRPDGSVLLVVAQRPPPADALRRHGAQWISTAGHRHGTMALRWVLAEQHPDPVCALAACDALDAAVAQLAGASS